MRKPKAPAPIELPYASTVASFYGDQGATQGNSFLGRIFRGRGQPNVQMRGNAPAAGSGGGAGNLGLIMRAFGMSNPTQTQTQRAPAATTKATGMSSFLGSLMK